MPITKIITANVPKCPQKVLDLGMIKSSFVRNTSNPANSYIRKEFIPGKDNPKKLLDRGVGSLIFLKSPKKYGNTTMIFVLDKNGKQVLADSAKKIRNFINSGLHVDEWLKFMDSRFFQSLKH